MSWGLSLRYWIERGRGVLCQVGTSFLRRSFSTVAWGVHPLLSVPWSVLGSSIGGGSCSGWSPFCSWCCGWFFICYSLGVLLVLSLGAFLRIRSGRRMRWTIKEAGTKVLASQLSLDSRARRSGWVGSTTLISSAFYSPTQLCGGGTTKSNSNEWPISVPLSFKCKSLVVLKKYATLTLWKF